jgi:hypothetical protein
MSEAVTSGKVGYSHRLTIRDAQSGVALHILPRSAIDLRVSLVR